VKGFGDSHRTITMRSRLLLLMLAALTLPLAAADPAEAKEDGDHLIKYPSPDGQYALRIPSDPGLEEKDDLVELVQVADKKVLLKLNDPDDSTSRSRDAKLDWSADSQRVAAYTGGRRGGSTRLFRRDGDRWVEVKLPELPSLPEEPSAALRKKHKLKGNFPRAITVGDLRFIRWEKTGVVLEWQDAWGGAEGTVSKSITITLEIDARGVAKIKKTTTQESFDKL
jgi:hypothetical protein